MTGPLTALVDSALVRAAAGPPAVRSRVLAERDQLTQKRTIVVSGRRGAGKTTVVNGLLGTAAGEVGLSAAAKPVRLFTDAPHDLPDWASTTLTASAFLRGRRVAELPDRAPSTRGVLLDSVSRLRPDVLVHVAVDELRAEESALLTQASERWGLAPTEVVVVVVDALSTSRPQAVVDELRTGLVAAGQVVAEDGSFVRTRQAIATAEGYAEARRAGLAINAVQALAAQQDDPSWSRQVLDDLERVSLSASAHVVDERRAVDAALSGWASLPTELLAELRRDFFPDESSPASPEDLAARAGRWQARVSRLAPREAWVARTAVRLLQLRGAAHPTTTPSGTAEDRQELTDAHR